MLVGGKLNWEKEKIDEKAILLSRVLHMLDLTEAGGRDYQR